MIEQLDHARGGAGHQAGVTAGQQPGARGREAVDVLPGVDCGDHARRVDLLRQGQLDQDPVDLVVGSQPPHQVDQLRLAGAAGQLVMQRAHPGLLAGPVLVGHVDVRCRVLPHQHRRQGRGASVNLREGGNAGPDPLSDLGRDRLAVDHARGHQRLRIGA